MLLYQEAIGSWSNSQQSKSYSEIYFFHIPKAFSIEEQDDKWLIDSACSMHMTGRLEFLRDYREVNFGGYVTFENDANGIIKGYGVLTNGNFTIQKVAYVLGLKHNLISVGQLVSTGLRVEFDNEFNYIMTCGISDMFTQRITVSESTTLRRVNSEDHTPNYVRRSEYTSHHFQRHSDIIS
ncbi:hypothetical protein L1887_40743 [Cichorium endivia]|nr:hypothetical protein L1887_40743 [Cichorium endivia]